METINAIADLEMSGHLSGEAVLEDLHHNAKLDANIVLSALKVGRTEYKSGNVVLVAGDGKVTANARLEQTDGFADVQAVSGLTWGDALVPTLDPSADTRAHIEAKGFRASAFLPFLRAQLNTLDGRIDANATVTMGRGAKVPTMEGKLAFHDGIVHVVGLGEGFKDARATVTLQPGGLIKIDDVYLKGSSGEVAAGAVVKTRGLAFESARVNVTIPKRKALDLALQGQPLGEVSGDFKLAATKSEDGKLTKLQLDVPTMNVDLPQQLKASVQSLSENPNIRVGVFRDPKTFVTLPVAAADLEPPEPKEPAATATALDVDVRLGEVTVAYGNQASVVLTGNPHVRIADETVLTGQIEAKGGKVNVQGKTFEIDRGTVTFQAEDASNPIVVLSAEWEADDGSEIFAEFVGPLKTGKMALRSVPPRPRNEVLAIILFGTADGANAPPPPGGGGTSATTKAAVGLGGGLAAQGLTEALDDIAGIKATAKVDTTRARNPAPGIEVQLTRRLSIGFARVLGTPPLSEPDVNLATIDWRFRSNWSIATTFGDRGLIQSDAVWQKRY